VETPPPAPDVQEDNDEGMSPEPYPKQTSKPTHE
jgi:two-component system sensor histidine kinase KdpD